MVGAANMRQRCWVEVDLDAIRHNVETLRARARCELLAVLKANAYGHGAAAVAQALEGKVALVGVANLQEAEAIEAARISAPILLLGACLPQEREPALRDGLQVSISSVTEAAEWNALAAKLGTVVHAHAVIDTGMGRMGFREDLWGDVTVRELLKLGRVRWEGLASHLPVADEDEAFTVIQIARFRKAVEAARDAGLHPRWVHLDNSAGLLGYPETAEFCNLARPGLTLYGVAPQPRHQPLLRPALSWKTRVILARELPAGQGISYGRTEILRRRSRVATLACGYADGYPRQVSGRGAVVLIRGRRCPVLGRVTMDQIMADVTDVIEPVEPGDEAVLLGGQGGQAISAGDLADLAGTIPWHVFTGITARVERVVLE